jgi:hypothetical protein
MRSNREEILKLYGSFYDYHYSEIGACFYCGDIGGEIDHCPPISWVESRTLTGWREAKIPLVKVSCCGSCNRTLGDKPFFTVYERLRFLVRVLEAEYERRASLWAEEEIKEMSPMFQRMIYAKKAQLIGLHARVRSLQQRLLNTESHPEF